MVLVSDWDVFFTQSQAMLAATPLRVRVAPFGDCPCAAAASLRPGDPTSTRAHPRSQTRLTLKYRHVDGRLTAKVTDGAKVCVAGAGRLALARGCAVRAAMIA